ncbi:tetratricopeptide repeat protein [bacterium]|nr:tetratricopeptide repeat protein [bacterium]
MTISFSCRACGHAMTAAPSHAGNRGPCPRCGQLVSVPRLGPADEPARAADTVIAPGDAGNENAPTVALPTPAHGAKMAPDPRPAPDDHENASGTLDDEVNRARADQARRFGRFILLTELGRGGMGVVHRAWDDRLRRIVALKTILPGSDLSSGAVARFRREAEAVARLRHPNIVSVHEAGELDGRHYIAMDFVAGRSLAQKLAPPSKLPLNRALESLRDVARAVHYAHEQGVVHRDLKPANVLLDASDRPFVLDFGLASIQGSRTKLTKTGAAMGTPAYMPPEQADGAKTDERSDVYSLGATLYHVLTGRPPFSGPSEVAVIASVLTKDPVPPGVLNRRAAGDLETITLKSLEKEPEKRYATARAFADDLDRYLAGEPIAARPTGRLGRARRWVRRNRLLAVALSLVVLVGTSSALLLAQQASARARDREHTLVAAAADESRRSRDAFDAASKAGLPEEVAGRGFEALDAASRLVDLAPDDVSARRRAFELAWKLADAAMGSEQWTIAQAALAKAERFGVDPPLLAKKKDELDAARSRTQIEHRLAVEKILGKLRAGSFLDLGGPEGALIALVRYPEPQTIALIASELDAVTARLRSARDAVYRQSRTEGIEAALLAWGKLPPGAAPDSATAASLRTAREAVEARERKERTWGTAGSAPRRFREIAASHQRNALGDTGVLLARTLCQCLGLIAVPKGPAEDQAVEALRGYIFTEEDVDRAAVAGIALCQIGTPRALATAEAGEAWFGITSHFWQKVQPAYARAAPSVTQAGPGPKTALEYHERALQRYNRNELAGAIADYDKAIEIEPRNSRWWRNRASTKLTLGDSDGALSDYDRAIELDPGNFMAWCDRGALKNDKMHDLEGAFSDFSKAIELNPGHALAWANRGRVRIARGDYDGAIADLDRALGLDSHAKEGWFDRGTARLHTGDLAGAVADLDRAIELSPQDATAWCNRGLAHRMKGDLDSALSDLDRAIALDPHLAKAWDERSNVRYKKGDLDGAMADATRAIELDVLVPRPHYHRGLARAGKNDYDGALDDLGAAIDLDPKLAGAWLSRGLIHKTRGNRAEAERDFARFLALAPDDRLAPEARAQLDQLRKK